MADWLESEEAIGAVDAVLAGVGLSHGRRATRGGSWKDGARVGKRPVSKPVRATEEPQVERVPGWDAFSWLRAGFSTRMGGQSGVYGAGDLNLGFTREDAAGTVAANRERFLKTVTGNKAFQLVGVRQFHAGMIRVVARKHGALATVDGRATLRGDGIMTAVPGLMLGVSTADCVPVLLVDVKQRVVAAFHAGWRGTLARIVERGVGTMRLQFGSKLEDLRAAVGPAIAACCFAVGEEVRFDFESQFSYARELFSEAYDSDPVREKYPLLFMTARAPGHSNLGPQIHLDLHEANRRQLLDGGLSPGNIQVLNECTACTRVDSRRKYFSHRAEHGFTGRMLSVAGVVG